jgi:hypothetical protein
VDVAAGEDRMRRLDDIEWFQWFITLLMIIPLRLAFKYSSWGLLYDRGDMVCPYWVGCVQLIVTALVILVLSAVQWFRFRRIPLAERRWFAVKQVGCVTLVGVFLLAAWVSPAIMINTRDKEEALVRARYHYHQGKWEDALAIYHRIWSLDSTAKEVVRSMQGLLHDAGYYNQPADGVPSWNILAALLRLQKDYGLAQDGILGPKSQTVLFGRVYSEILGLDEVQMEKCESIRDAVIRFQQAHALATDGYIGWKTAKELEAVAVASVGSYDVIDWDK